MGLRFARPEVSRPSSEYELLANLRQGTDEYTLIRGADLSFEDPVLAAYHYRSYTHWHDALCSQPRYDHYLSFYHDALGQLYQDLSAQYRDLACYLDPSVQNQNIYDSRIVLWDKQIGQTTCLPLLLFEYNPQHLGGVLQERSSLREYEAAMARIQTVINMLPASVKNTRRGDFFHDQLCYLYAFYGGVREVVSQYQHMFSMPTPESAHIGVSGQVAVRQDQVSPVTPGAPTGEVQYSPAQNGSHSAEPQPALSAYTS